MASPFSLRLDPATKARLDQEARRLDRSSSYVAAQAIEAWLDARAAKRAAIQSALDEAEKGEFISQGAMAQWMGSWGTESETAPPEPDAPPARRKT